MWHKARREKTWKEKGREPGKKGCECGTHGAAHNPPIPDVAVERLDAKDARGALIEGGKGHPGLERLGLAHGKGQRGCTEAVATAPEAGAVRTQERGTHTLRTHRAHIWNRSKAKAHRWWRRSPCRR